MQNIDKHKDSDQLLDEILSKPPEFVLPFDFAARIAAKAAGKFYWRQYMMEFLVYIGTFTGLVAVILAMNYFWFTDNWHSWKQFFSDNLSIVIGINVIGLFILFADRVLLQYFCYRFSRKKHVSGKLW
jgi:hypothetical protein